MLHTLTLVFLGGGIGAVLRFASSELIHKHFGLGFPYGTLAVNIAGSFLIGVIAALLSDFFPAKPLLHAFLVIGVLGGFTTFSAFSLDTYHLFVAGKNFLALLNVTLSIAGCILAAWVGHEVVRL